jgi:hypothetical protein
MTWREGSRDSSKADCPEHENERKTPEQFTPDGIFCCEAVTRRSLRRLSRIAKGLRTRCSERALARIAKGGGLIVLLVVLLIVLASKVSQVSPETSQPGAAERAVDTATDVSRTITEVTAALRLAMERLRDAISDVQRPGRPVARLRTITREAPLTSLVVAFLLGVAISRRR